MLGHKAGRPGLIILVSALAMMSILACTEEIVKEIPVEKIVEKEVVREIPVEKIVEKEVVKEVPVERVVVKEIPVEKIVKELVEVVKEVVKEVPVEVVVEKEVVRTVEIEKPVIVEKEVIKEVVREVEKVVIATPVPAGQEPWKLMAVAANATRGGHLVLGAHGPPAHFDVWASPTIANAGSQGAMFDLLIRHDPRENLFPIVPDLAHRWDISPDGMRYTFQLRRGVEWHDGSDFSAEDVKATYDRIIFPPEGIVSQRQPLFSAVSEINIIGDYAVEFVLDELRSDGFMLSAFATGWDLVAKKESFEENDWSLREVDNFPGTGPFKYESRDSEKWDLVRNPNYWNENAPYVDRISHVWLFAWSPVLAAALLGGQVDWSMWVDPVTFRTVQQTQGMSTLELTLPGVDMLVFNTETRPTSDVRVRRAINLAVDKPALVEILKDTKALTFQGWYMPNTPYAYSPAKLHATPGHRSPTADDLAMAKQLLADAGYPNGEGFPELNYLVRETADQRLVGPAVQAMLKENLNIDAKINLGQASAYVEDLNAGNFDIGTWAYGGGLMLDPAGWLNQAWGQCDGELCSQNQSRYRNAEFDDLVSKFSQELSLDNRLKIAEQIREILSRDVPSLPYGIFTVQWGWYNHLKGVTPGPKVAGGHDVFKWDHVWLDRR